MAINLPIPVFEPCMGDSELAQLKSCIDTNWISGGPKVKEFEKRIALIHQVKHAIACSNGTMALFMALRGCGIDHGEVIVPAFTFVSSASAVVLAGAKPVFVDVNKDTGNMLSEAVKKAIKPDTTAIMPVHIYGQSADMDALKEPAGGIPIIEDAAQGLAVTWNGRPVGGIGNAGILSFYADKTITTGEGGMVLTNDDDVARQCRILKHQGRDGRGWYIHEYIGWNFRMTDLQAAVGLAQLDKLAIITHRKREIRAVYHNLLAVTPEINFMVLDERCNDVPFRVNILVPDPVALAAHLTKHNIQTRSFFYPLHKQPCFNTGQTLPNSEWLYEHGLSLPSSVNLTGEQIEYVCAAIREFYK